MIFNKTSVMASHTYKRERILTKLGFMKSVKQKNIKFGFTNFINGKTFDWCDPVIEDVM